jgi:hypothetical protein
MMEVSVPAENANVPKTVPLATSSLSHVTDTQDVTWNAAGGKDALRHLWASSMDPAQKHALDMSVSTQVTLLLIAKKDY